MSLPAPEDDPRPVEPEQPDLDACCGSGCDPCIFDLYDAQRESWHAAMRAWRARQAAREAAATGPAEAPVDRPGEGQDTDARAIGSPGSPGTPGSAA